MIMMLLIKTGRMMTIRKVMLLMVVLLVFVILTKAIFFAHLLLQCLRRCRLDGVLSLEQARVQWDCGEEGHQVVVAHLVRKILTKMMILILMMISTTMKLK